MELFLLSEQIPDKSSVNKPGKFFSCASCYEDPGTLFEQYLLMVRLTMLWPVNKHTYVQS